LGHQNNKLYVSAAITDIQMRSRGDRNENYNDISMDIHDYREKIKQNQIDEKLEIGNTVEEITAHRTRREDCVHRSEDRCQWNYKPTARSVRGRRRKN
jgi:hypothetical protein